MHLILTALISTFLSASYATSFSQVPFASRASHSDVIVLGKINKIHSDWAHDQNGNNRIYTFYEADVIDVVKGDFSKDYFTFRQAGGSVGSSELHYPGSANFYEGETVLVFLANTREGLELKAMQMGKYKLKNESGKTVITGAGISKFDYYQIDVDEKQEWTIETLKKALLEKKEQKPQAVQYASEIQENLEETPKEEQIIIEEETESVWSRFFKNEIAVSVVLLFIMFFLFRRLKSRRNQS